MNGFSLHIEPPSYGIPIAFQLTTGCFFGKIRNYHDLYHYSNMPVYKILVNILAGHACTCHACVKSFVKHT